GMLGEGITHGSPVSAMLISGRQPAMTTTSTFGRAPTASGTCSAANHCASSPVVRPCRNGTDTRRTKLEHDGTKPGPAVAAPNGLGRSSTTTGTPVRALEHNRSYSDQM